MRTLLLLTFLITTIEALSQDFVFLPKDNQISQVVRTVFQDSKNNIWFGTENGAFKYNGKSLIHINDIKDNYGKGVTIKDITENADGKIWLGHTGGLSYIDGSSVKNYYEKDGLISDDVWCLASDKEGKIWIGTSKGTSVFDGRKFSDFELPEGEFDTTVGVSGTKMVHSILQDRKGTLWFSTNAGLFSYSGSQLVNVSETLGIPTNFINEVFEDSKGILWISTKKGLFYLEKNKVFNLTANKIEIGKGIGSIAEDKNGTIWFVFNQHSLYTYNGKELVEYMKNTHNNTPAVFKIFKDLKDRLWFIGYGGAYRLENGKLINITQNGLW